MTATKKTSFQVFTILKHQGKVIRTQDESYGGTVSLVFDPLTVVYIDNVRWEAEIFKIDTDHKRNTMRVHYRTTRKAE